MGYYTAMKDENVTQTEGMYTRLLNVQTEAKN